MFISEKDVEDGKKLAEMFEQLAEEDKNQCLIYMSALVDKAMVKRIPYNQSEEELVAAVNK